jgi:hypothetical protein
VATGFINAKHAFKKKKHFILKLFWWNSKKFTNFVIKFYPQSTSLIFCEAVEIYFSHFWHLLECHRLPQKYTCCHLSYRLT